MDKERLTDRIKWWLVMVPIYFAYRLIWLMAKTGQVDARSIQAVMWDAQLDVPPLTARQKAELADDLAEIEERADG
jgi:hypothetical protein